VDAYYEGRWQEALDLYDRSKALRERIGDVVGAAQITNNVGEVKSDQGYVTTASELFREAGEVFETSGHRMLAILTSSNLGRAAAREGRLDDAKRLLERALADFEEIDASGFALEARAFLAERAALAGDAANAIERADAVLAAIAQGSGGSLHHAFIHRIRGYALAQQGDAAGARAAFEQSLEIALGAEETYQLALALEAKARLAEHLGEDGSQAAREARALLARLGVVATPEFPL
jgi:tetratricopeptide (TPR) repeat protein